MTVNDPSTQSVQEANALPRHTTPTWEVELLISGVAVFAMLQLPGWLDERFFALIPRFDSDSAGMLAVLYVYLKSASLILAITFMLHLTLRAHWIALVGMHSVFPDGVHWDRLRIGPIRRTLEQQRLGSTSDAIERSDNRATMVFALGVTLGTLMLVFSLVAGAVCGAITALRWTTGIRLDLVLVLISMLAVFLLPFLAAHLLDRRFGAALAETSWQRRALTRMYRVYARTGVGGSYVSVLVSSRTGEVRAALLVALVFVLASGGASLGLITLNSPGWLGNYARFPYFTDGSHTMSSSYYDDQRDVVHSKLVPFIQSDVITDPYLRLVVPYQPDRDDDALQRTCAPMLALADAQARAEGTLVCLGKLHAATLDGKPIPGLRYESGSDARARRPALVAMIDLRALAPGRHELRVMRAPAKPGSKRRRDQASEYVIPFWR